MIDEPNTGVGSSLSDRIGSVRQTMTSFPDSGSRARQLNAVVAVAADQIDESLIGAAETNGSPIAGKIVGIKDMIDVAGMSTRYGSDLGTDTAKPEDAEVVGVLRRAGGIVGVKTTTHEFAYGPTGDVTNTGPVLNPHDEARMAGGSSAGSAVLLGDGSIDLALGTDTGGSGRTPAAFCGVYGLRPTSGALNSRGVFPLSTTLDTVSPMARTADGLWDLWRVLTDETNVDDSIVNDSIGGPLTIAELRGGQWSNLASPVAVAVAAVRDRLIESGHHLSQAPAEWTDWTQALYLQVQGPEAVAVHRQNLAERPEGYQPEVLSRLKGAEKVSDREYADALEEVTRMRSRPDEYFGDADLLLCSTTPVTAPLVGARSGFGAGRNTAREIALAHTLPFSVLGVPAINVPVWLAGQPMPAGVQLVGRPGSENMLLTLAIEIGDLRTVPCDRQ